MFLVPGSSPSTLSAVIHTDIQDRRLPEASDTSYRLSSLSEKESKASWGNMQRLQSQLYCPTLDRQDFNCPKPRFPQLSLGKHNMDSVL